MSRFSPATLVTPYIVVGSSTVRCGVPSRGVVGPNAAIELGQKIFFTPHSRAASRVFFSPTRFMSNAASGFFSPVAERSEAS